jgi:methyl-accepting chemotaxis protein
VYLSIANRVLLGFLIVLALTVGLGVYSVTRIAEVRETTETIVARDLSVLRQITDIRARQQTMTETRQAALLRLLSQAAGRTGGGNDDPIASWRSQAAETERLTEAALRTAETLQARALTAVRADAWREVAAALGRVLTDLRQLRGAADRQLSFVEQNNVDAAMAVQPGLADIRHGLADNLALSEQALSNAIAVGQLRVAAVYDEAWFALAVGIAATTVIGLILAFAIRTSINRPLEAFTGFVERVGRGDLAGEPAASGPDEIGRLGQTLNQMVEGLRQMTKQSREATENLNAAAAEIRASTQEQAASVEEQLAAVQETAATVDEITHSGAQIGKRAEEVIAAAQATAVTSRSGLQAVEETNRAMDTIREQGEAVAENIVALSEKTQAIGEIISTVNDISERSHLLALNAAIEAAAAGENGRSFAIVAAEMKTLADQAKEATTQVRSILGDIQRGINSSVMLTEEAVKRVAVGKSRAEVTEQTIQEISTRIQESVQTFQQIVASTNQQQLGIEQVMGALQNIRQASQQTAAGTRQLDTAASNLSTLSQQLVVLSDRYRL